LVKKFKKGPIKNTA